MSYRPPLTGMLFTLRHVAGLDRLIAAGGFADLTPDLADAVLSEAGKLAEERHDEIANALKCELAKYQGSNGVMMDSSSWKVTARNP